MPVSLATKPPLSERCRGRWRDLLGSMGVPAKFLNGKSQPCPFCGGTDRFTFDDKAGAGSYICRGCGAGDGIDFAQKWLKVDFKEAAMFLEKELPGAAVVAPKVEPSRDRQSEVMKALWKSGRRLDGTDIGSRYLASRGIVLEEWSPNIRSVDVMTYFHDDKDKRRDRFPGIVANFRSPDGLHGIIHRTYLTEPGQLALVPKPRMLMPGKVPEGGAVRLGEASATMGIAEGLETAMSAAIVHQVPVWAALTAGAMMRWLPPLVCENVLIFGDIDPSFAGQNAAYLLATRLRNMWRDVEKTKRYQVEVMFTLFHDTGFIKEDWNDVVQNMKESAVA